MAFPVALATEFRLVAQLDRETRLQEVVAEIVRLPEPRIKVAKINFDLVHRCQRQGFVTHSHQCVSRCKLVSVFSDLLRKHHMNGA